MVGMVMRAAKLAMIQIVPATTRNSRNAENRISSRSSRFCLNPMCRKNGFYPDYVPRRGGFKAYVEEAFRVGCRCCTAEDSAGVGLSRHPATFPGGTYPITT